MSADTPIVRLTFGVIELLLAYGFASWAVDSGRLLAWFLAIVLLAAAAQNFIKLIWKAVRHGHKV